MAAWTYGDLMTRVGRALRRRCPHCGEGRLFDGWLTMRPRCPACGLDTNRGDQGYRVGTYVVNLIVAELTFVAIMITVLVLTWPDPPWTLLQYGGGALMIVLPLLFHPFARALFLAADTLMRPVTPEELAGRASGERL